MGRGRRAAAGGQCGVWLDTAELKRSAAQPKASGRALERKLASVAFTQTRACQPRTRQTTIAAFFRARADGKDKENAKPSSVICKEKNVSLAASPVKILALPRMEEAQKRSFGAEEDPVQAPPQRCAQKAAASPPPLPDSWLVQVESCSKSEASCGVGEDCCRFSFTQDSEGNRFIAHSQESHLSAEEMVSASGRVTSAWELNKREARAPPEETKTRPDFQPRLGASQNKKSRQSNSVNSLIDSSETENRNPTTKGASTWAAAFYSSPQRPARAEPLRARSQNAGAGAAQAGPSSPCRQLFTQDSEGNRVIAHRCRKVPSPGRDEDSSRQLLPSSPGKGCSSHAAKRSPNRPGEQLFDACYNLLFTQDSEGNWVIKH